MKRTSACLALIATIAFAPAAFAEVEFGGLDLGAGDALLFSAQADLPGGGSFSTLLSADLAKGSMAQLTLYPEHVTLIEGGRRLQVQNRYGLWRSDANLSSMAPVAGYPAFARGAGVRSGRLLANAASQDGAYVLSAVPTSAAYARLVLFDVAKGAETVVASKLEYSVEDFPARWSPDSRRFVYAKAGSIYYYSVDQFVGGRVVDESYRRIGAGRIQNVRWGQDGSLFYLRGSSLFRILPAEFFTQALYRGAAGMGSLAGKTPFPFDPSFDSFWVSPDGSRLVLAKGGRNLFLLYLDPDDYGSEPRVNNLPYLFLQGDTVVRDLLWPSGGLVTVFTGSLRDGSRSSGAYRLEAPPDPSLIGLAPAVTELDAKGALEMVLSPDGSRVAVVTPDGVKIRSFIDWSLKGEVKAPGALHALWASDDRLVVAGSRLIEAVTLSTGARSLVALSQAEKYGRAEDGSILAQVGGLSYRRPQPAAVKAGAAPASVAQAPISWTTAATFDPLPTATSSEAYRVYLDAVAAGSYRNTVMVRSVKALGTRALFPPPPIAYAPFPDKDEARANGFFDHGSRIRRREVSIVFNALEGSEGLVGVLGTLKDYGIRATFFVNGEFIRQSPGAARLLAGSDNEIGSMFFTTMDPTDARFKIDRDYVRRGLARTEDDWFAATGKELSVLWHTPYYTVNSEILEAGATMKYFYIGRDIDPLDWVSRADAAAMPGAYLDAHAMVEKILGQVKPGSIIPVRLGVAEGGRDDYLFRELALLVDALVGAGYDIVPVSALMQHAE